MAGVGVPRRPSLVDPARRSPGVLTLVPSYSCDTATRASVGYVQGRPGQVERDRAWPDPARDRAGSLVQRDENRRLSLELLAIRRNILKLFAESFDCKLPHIIAPQDVIGQKKTISCCVS